MTSNPSYLTAAFTLPSGATEYAFFPGAWRDLSSTNIWLATGQIVAIVCDSEIITGSGFVLDVHDYHDVTTYNTIKGGTNTVVGACTVTGPGTLKTGPALATPVATTSTSEGGFEVFATAKPAAFVAGNKLFTLVPNLATIQSYPVRSQCLHGMAVLFTGGAATAAEHKVSIIYEPFTMGHKRKKLYDNYRTATNAGALSFA